MLRFYLIGIVDFLQDWSTKKKIERAFKIYFGRKDPDGLSVMEPKPYKLRFQGELFSISKLVVLDTK
jgi:Phosphatidylinositol-4-phosphate 5-Kinase